MKSTRLLIGLFAIGATLTTVGACAHSGQAAGDVIPANILNLHVANENFLDMDVYAVSHGLATRVGTVTGNTSRNFVISATLSGQDFDIVAAPIGGNGRASTGTINPAPGQTIDFTIGSVMSHSTVSIR